jgi:endonuclease/exonuclease/phosphatase family metal-dependent hydrolase
MPTDAAHDPTMTALPYANPVFTRVQAANKTLLGPLSQWQAVWPRVPRPAAGDPVRFGTYNVMLAGREDWETRMPAIARNIATRNLTVVALQETLSTDGSDVAAQLTQLTGHPWAVAPSDRTEGRILYDSSRFTLSGSGSLSDYSPSDQRVVSYRTGDEIRLPWARLTAIGSDRSFVVVSIHFAPSDVTSGPTAQGNQETGASARAVLAALDNLTGSAEPAVIAGDFAGGYGLWGDQNPAQPTLVRAGWWDSMASMSKAGVAYSTVNQRKPQVAASTLGGRADGIFLRGIHGTLEYQNVANYYLPGTRTPPSDHNLVFTEFQVPN